MMVYIFKQYFDQVPSSGRSSAVLTARTRSTATPIIKCVADVVNKIEIKVGRQLTFSRMLYDEFYYRLSVHDRFINDILSSRHEVVVDSENILQR